MLESVNWIRDALNMGRQVDDGNNISLVYAHNKMCFQFDMSKWRRSEFSNGKYPDSAGKSYSVNGSFYLPSYATDLSMGGLILMQWHSRYQEEPGVPLNLQVRGNRLLIQQCQDECEFIYDEPVIYDRWVPVRFEYNWRDQIKVWIDGKHVVSVGKHSIAEHSPYWKFGAYRIGDHSQTFPRITMYWSDVRKTNE